MLIPLLNHDGRQYHNTDHVDLLQLNVPEPIVMSAVDIVLVARGDKAIDDICDQVFTQSASRAERYSRKYSEAIAYKAAGYPANVAQADYPFLIVEAPARGLTKKQQADEVIARAEAFAALGANAEALRAQLLNVAQGADSVDAKQSAVNAAVQQLRDAVAGAGV